MKWKKRGKIFDPTEHSLPNQCREFAQSPQALVFSDFVRIYFSTREKDPKNGKYLSHIAFVDFEKNLKNIIRVSKKTVITLGQLGSFDEHGIFPINVLRHKNRIYAYTCGWSRRTSVSVDTSIGFATSDDDGLTFNKLGSGPILSSSLNEPFLVGDAFVKIYDNVFHMWYMFGTQWKQYAENTPPDRTYKIGHATSIDGVEWKKEDGRQLIPDKLNKNESMALPSVIKDGDRYHMFFCYRESSDFRKASHRGYRIGYAYSDNLDNWTRDDTNVGLDVSDRGWDSNMLCYPHVFDCDDKTYMLYNGNEFGRYGFGIAELER
ncbi:hypothetical protein A9Q81_18800 [Gammaproteobacteria bacterium 42_54_T18]|nr:hypothetical protein A9Q81_18800 [Gammaproteobacteria bacterium 42_54_T18]